MNLTQAIVYYIFAFVLTLAFIICGCLIGAALRKKKDAKLSEKVDSVDISTDNSDLSGSKN